MTMKYTIVWCAIVIGCWVVNSANSSPPQCFKLKFGEISCNQAVDANTILKTTSSDCFQSQKGAKVLEILHKNTNQMEQITKYIKSHNSDCGKYKKMYDEGKAEINKLTKTVQTCNVKVSTLEKKLKQKEKPVGEKWKVCAVGIQDPKVIPNDRMTASSYYSANYLPHNGRLLSTAGIGAWGPIYSDRSTCWLQVDLGRQTTIYGIVTQGIHKKNVNEWVTTYQVSYQRNSEGFKYVTDQSGTVMVFQGNTDRNTPVQNNFPAPISARYFRVHPKSYRGHPSLRFELLTC